MYRTMLFVPADDARKRDKSVQLAADAVILDLEDAVAIQEKPKAREDARRFIQSLEASNVALYVRVNDMSTSWVVDDLVQVTVPGLTGIVLPKVESGQEIYAADWLLRHRERELGLEEGHFDLIPIIETSEGIANAYEIAVAASRIKVLALGAGDYTNDIGVPWPQDDGAELYYPRVEIVNVSRRAGLYRPLDGPWPLLNDLDGLEKDAQRALRLGFGGKLVIHPNQIDPVNRIFSPSEEEVARARAIVEAFAEAERQGKASIRVGEEFVDYPIVQRAQQVLAEYERIQAAAARRAEVD